MTDIRESPEDRSFNSQLNLEPFGETTLDSERRRRSMLDIEFAEGETQPDAYEDEPRFYPDQHGTVRRDQFTTDHNMRVNTDIQVAVQYSIAPSSFIEQQLEMVVSPETVPATRHEDHDASSGRRPGTWFCCRNARDACSQHFCSMPRGAICCPPNLLVCEIDDEDLEAHLHCMRGCYVFSEIIRKIEPCEKVRPER